MSSPVFLSPRAETQLDVIDSWWRAHRPSAPDLFLEEFLALVDVLTVLPDCGQRYLVVSAVVVRRYLLRATRYHVYYRRKSGRVYILSIWSAARGAGPHEDDLLS